MQTIQIKKDVNFCIFQNGQIRKIFKILFQRNKPDFFILFPYFEAAEYQMGTMVIPKGVNTLPTYDVSKNKKASSTLPVKISYHMDGNIHFKPVNPVQALLSLSHKFDAIKSTPIKDLTGEHIFTLTFEGLDKFQSASSNDHQLETVNITSVVLSTVVTFKVTGWAGFSENEVKGKYGSLEPIIIKLIRPQLQQPLFIAFYLLAGDETIQNGPVRNPFLVSMVGFQKAYADPRNDLSTLYLFARS